MRRFALGAVLWVAGCSTAPEPPSGVREVTVRGHEDARPVDGGLLPRAFGSQPVGICVGTDAAVDSSGWSGRLRWEGVAEGTFAFEVPVVRMESTVCFERSPPAAAGRARLCLDVRDDFDGTTFSLPCQEVELATEAADREALDSRLRALLAEPPAGGVGPLVEALDLLESEAKAAGYPFLAVRIGLVSVYFLRRNGSDSSMRDAARRLASSPDWLAHPAASAWAAQTAQTRALLELSAQGNMRRAWRNLQRADSAYLRIADPNRFTVAMQRAEILGRLGASREAVTRLRAALADCRLAPCTPRLLAPAEGTLAWLILQNPDSSSADLDEAGAIIERALGRIDRGSEPLEHANQQLNMASIRARQGRDPGEALAAAEELLVVAPPGRRRDQLLDWRRLIAADWRLDAGDGEVALDVCRALSSTAQTPRLAAWAVSCEARARRRLGDLEGAAEAFERALLLHEYSSPEALGQRLSLGPGRQGQDYFGAARLAVERGRHGDAWRLLERLDAVAATRLAGPCDEDAGGRPEEEREGRRTELLSQLAALEVPASGPRREQREPIRRALLGELQELARTSGDCLSIAPTSDAGVDYRAFAADDEVVLLGRRPTGWWVRRTPIARAETSRRVQGLREALERGADDSAWRALAAPLSRALAPAALETGETATYALHGSLQDVPLAALPRPDRPSGWLADRGVLVVRPALARRSVGARGEGNLFAVDPRNNLPAGRRLSALYTRLFPGATVLSGGAATSSALSASLPTAGLLHLDTHGVYDPAFPELSRLFLADSTVDMQDIAGWSGAFGVVNLSGCDTGRWPTTADSGRFGLGGLFCRRGASWVVASRAPLADDVAADFNSAFYEAVAAGEPVPSAYAAGLAAARRGRPASRWGALVLLASGEPRQGKTTVP